jgi:hypothetical protein
MRTDDLDAVKSKLYEESEPFLSAHPNYDISTLPSWVAESIEVARVYGNSKKGVILPDGRKYHLDNHLNDLTGREWTFFINSVFSTHYPTSGKEAYVSSAVTLIQRALWRQSSIPMKAKTRMSRNVPVKWLPSQRR